ncbi:MAG TPA: N-acetylneuraminate synthase family protein [Dehalococcoidia bacterium]|nr:N-acetylneuraminate synthase family protein [Dehalococcoidia bacterium]
MATIRIGSRTLDPHSPPYVIAEIGVNHGGSMARARELIQLAREGGADAAKFQSYKAETLASRHSPSYWDRTKEPTASQYDLFKKYDAFNADDYVALARCCVEAGLDFLSTPFDDAAVDFLAPLVPAFKIASADLTNVPLLRRVARHGKPVLLSVGASTVAEVDGAIATLRQAGCRELALLHCVLNYPTSYADANLNMIVGLRQIYPDFVLGYSDHTLPDPAMTVLTTAHLLGAVVLEKHFTYDKSLQGNDHYHAMDAADLQVFRRQAAFIREIGGTAVKAPLASEEIARRHARRSIVVRRAVEAGATLAEADLICKRPGTGISPLHWDEIVGRRAARPLEADALLQWDDLAGA